MRSPSLLSSLPPLAAFSLTVLIISGCSADSVGAPVAAALTSPASAKQTTTSGRMLVWSTAHGLVSMDDDGSDLRALAGALPTGSGAAWAPDGKRIVFAGRDGAAPTAIFVMNDDGTGITRLSTPPDSCEDIRPAVLGKQVVFLRECGPLVSLLSLNTDDGGLTTLVPSVDPTPPAPSPKGTYLAYGKDLDIWLLDVDAATHTNLTKTPHITERAPSFAPSGKRIAFVSATPAGMAVSTMNIDGTSITPLISDQLRVFSSPRWSPDGKRIAFATDLHAPQGVTDVFVMNVDGTNLTNITRTQDQYEDPLAWARF